MRWIFWLSIGALLAVAHGQAFFAMDTGLRGDPEQVASVLEETGFDGWGASGDKVGDHRAALEGRGLKLWNVYRTIDIVAGASAVTPELRSLLNQMKGGGGALWLAIRQVEGSEETAVAAVREIADEGERAGVEISLYPHAGHWLDRFSAAGKLAKKVDRKGVGVTFNLCHWLKVEGDVDPMPEIVRERDRLQFVTVNGADGGDTKGMGWDRLIQPLGQGTYNVGGFLSRLRDEVKWRGPVGLQAYGVPGDPVANLRQSMAAWRRLNGLLDGRVLCGYQGWFRCEGDGADNGWHHYAVQGKFEPGFSHIEMWPDVSELGAEERHATPFRHADGRVAEVFSSVHPATIQRHFRWMGEHGIDGVFLQRFAANARDPKFREPMDRVLSEVKSSAAAEGREWALMYDLSGLKPEDFPTVEEDWQRLDAGADPAYLKHRGRPLVALWGLGFNDRPAALDEWERLVGFFKKRGFSVMLGVPCYWRTLDRDAIGDRRLWDIMEMADIVSPWAVGRFGTPEEAQKREQSLLRPDLAWCRERGVDYLPVIFPGFSWWNLEKSRGREAVFDSIPRRGGSFLWSQAIAARRAGGRSLYVAMFDEMDEGTAIFKTTSDTPVGASRFLAEPTVKPDHYLWLTGEIGRMLRGQIPAANGMPAR